MVNLLKKYKLFIMIAAIPYIAFILFTTVPTSYRACLPGSIEEIENVVEIENSNGYEGSYNSTSVTVLAGITMFQRLAYANTNGCYVYKESDMESTLSYKEEDIQGKIEHDSSIVYSIIAAYNKAGIFLDYRYKGTYVYYANNDYFEIGDIVLQENGLRPEILLERFYSGMSFNIIRNGEQMTINPTSVDDVVLHYDYYELGDASIPYVIKESNTQGPSAGFMQTLALYDSLMEEDHTKGLKIAGTGTIDLNGNVGAIGAISVKILTAEYNDVDVFFAPIANEEEAKIAYSKLVTDMKLVFVDNLDDAIAYLGGDYND